MESRSLSIIASTLDSLLDLLSGFILWYTAHSMRRENLYKYPIGNKRMQPLVRQLSSPVSNQDRVMAYNILINSRLLSSPQKGKDVKVEVCSYAVAKGQEVNCLLLSECQ